MKNIVIYSLLIIILFVQACSSCKCGNPSTSNPENDPTPSIPWDVTGNLYQAQAWIDHTDTWLNGLGIKKIIKETVVVNASNDNIMSPGGGIDGALATWANNNGVTSWTTPAPTLPDGTAAPKTLAAGKFALFPVSFGYIYLAVGPKCSQVRSLNKLKTLVADLYYNILRQANKDSMKAVVLPAISTELFAGAGQETDSGKNFTKDEFISYVYEGMKHSIGRFQQENPQHTLKIILNNWDQKIVKQVKAFTP